MQLYYLNLDGTIVYAVCDADLVGFVDSCNMPHATLAIDEVTANLGVVGELARTQGVGKYKVAGGVLCLLNGTPVPLATNTDKSDLLAALTQALIDLDTIINGVVGSNTLATQNAVKRLGQICKALLKRLAQVT